VEEACKFSSFAPNCTVRYVENDTWLQYPILSDERNPKHIVTQTRILGH